MSVTTHAEYLRELQKAKTNIIATQCAWEEQAQNELISAVADLQVEERFLDKQIKELEIKEIKTTSLLDTKVLNTQELLSTDSRMVEEELKTQIDALILAEATRALLLQAISSNDPAFPATALDAEKIMSTVTSVQAGIGSIEMKAEELARLKEASLKHLEQVFEWLSRKEGSSPA